VAALAALQGTGTRGWDLIKYTGGTDSAKVVAVCGVYKPHLRTGAEAAGNRDVKTHLDYRDLLARRAQQAERFPSGRNQDI